MTDVQTIEQQRKRYDISVRALCSAANIDDSTYGRLLRGEQKARGSTIARLEAGLKAARKGDANTRLDLIWRLLTALMAFDRNISIERLKAHNPQDKATSDPKWCEVQELRDLAVYALHAVVGVPNVEIARVAKVKPAAITYAVQRVEERREKLLTDKMFDLLEEAVSG